MFVQKLIAIVETMRVDPTPASPLRDGLGRHTARRRHFSDRQHPTLAKPVEAGYVITAVPS
jgi:hypothetical protein